MSMKYPIPSRCVSLDWRRLILRADLRPTRPRFLELHLPRQDACQFALLLIGRTDTSPFGQQAYIVTLKEQWSTPEAEIP